MKPCSIRAFAFGACLLVACSAGSGATLTEATFGRDQPPGFLRDDPGSRRDDPGGSRDPTGSSCIGCDQNYRCSGTIDGLIIDVVVHLASRDGACTSGNTTFACSGALTDNGKLVASWSHIGGGGFRVCQKSSCVDCLPTNESPTPIPEPQPQPGNGGGGSTDASSND